jgi:preprotein translocase subunit SecD
MMGNDREIIVAENIYDEKKNTIIHKTTVFDIVEDTIQNGVKQTSHSEDEDLEDVEDTIQNGVKQTRLLFERYHVDVEDAIQNGVKRTFEDNIDRVRRVEDTIQNGVKETRNNKLLRTVHVMNTIINGVKVSKPMDEWVNTERIVDKVVKDGVKETQPLPAQDGNRDWGNYYHGKEDRTKPFNEYLDEAIRFGVKEVIDEKHHRTREVVLTIKDGVKETYDDCSDNIARVEGIIRVGKKIDKDGI